MIQFRRQFPDSVGESNFLNLCVIGRIYMIARKSLFPYHTLFLGIYLTVEFSTFERKILLTKCF